MIPKRPLFHRDFDLLRNLRPAVPMYADGPELLAFRPSLPSAGMRAESSKSETHWGFPFLRYFPGMDPLCMIPKRPLFHRDFDLLRNLRPAVPMYADGHELLAFRPSLPSAWMEAESSKLENTLGLSNAWQHLPSLPLKTQAAGGSLRRLFSAKILCFSRPHAIIKCSFCKTSAEGGKYDGLSHGRI